MDPLNTIFGKNVLMRCRGTVGTAQVNLNPLAALVQVAGVLMEV